MLSCKTSNISRIYKDLSCHENQGTWFFRRGQDAICGVIFWDRSCVKIPRSQEPVDLQRKEPKSESPNLDELRRVWFDWTWRWVRIHGEFQPRSSRCTPINAVLSSERTKNTGLQCFRECALRVEACESSNCLLLFNDTCMIFKYFWIHFGHSVWFGTQSKHEPTGSSERSWTLQAHASLP